MIERATSGVTQDGETVLLVDPRDRRYLVALQRGQTFHSHLGLIPHEALIGQPEGAAVETSLGETFVILRPTIEDFILKMPRHTNVVYPKDLALILIKANVRPGSVVVEAGLGSAGLASGLLQAVGPAGRVISYERRPEFVKKGLNNIRRFCPDALAWHEARAADVCAGIEEREVDAVVLDIPEPWRAIGPAMQALRQGGAFVSYVPTVPQVQQTVLALRETGRFVRIETVETLVRRWEVGARSVRPAQTMVGHTGFLTSARFVERAASQEAGAVPESDEDLRVEE